MKAKFKGKLKGKNLSVKFYNLIARIERKRC